jgi:hypothetical protein
MGARAFPLALLLGLTGLACATYSEKIQTARSDLAAGRPESAIAIVNESLGVKSADEVPASFGGDRALLLLERAALLQAIGDHRRSARDMTLADDHLEVLDVEAGSSLDLGRYLFSDDAVPYRAPPYERLLLNTLNCVNFLAMGDFEGAKVEARRFRILEAYYLDGGSDVLLRELLAVGNYVAGVSFESAGEYSEAARHFARAFRFGLRDDEFRERLRDLFRVAGAPGPEIATGGALLSEIDRDAVRAGPLPAQDYRRLWVDGSLLVVVQSGFAPYKRPERIPIGLALTWAAAVHHGHTLSDSERRRTEKLMVEGLVKWLNFPVLTRAGVAGGAGVEIRIDGKLMPPTASLDAAAQIQAGWERVKPTLMVAAISRMLVRIGVGYGTGKAVEGGLRRQGDAEKGTASVIGWLAGLAVEAGLTAADTPDTRSWTMLPARITIVRTRPQSGARSVLVTVSGRQDGGRFEAPRQGTLTVALSRYR